jgi:hypothetical protein
MTFAYNPINDKQYLTSEYKWRTYTIKPSEVAKNQLKYEFIGISNIALQSTTKKHVAQLQNGKQKTFFLEFNPLSLDCIIVYKSGEKELTRWDHVYKNDTIYLKGLPLSKLKTSDIDKIILIDELRYHESMLQYWSENGFSFSKSLEACKHLLQDILNIA